MRLRSKLYIAIGFLFSLVVALGALSIYFLNRSNQDSRSVLQANLNSIRYMSDLFDELNQVPLSDSNYHKIEKLISSQERNITEEGEKELTTLLRKNFSGLKTDSGSKIRMEEVANDILQLNSEAIQRKTNAMEKSTENALIWLSFIGGISFLLSFTLFLNLPGAIANPIEEMIESVRAIASQDYSKRLHFKEHHEYSILAQSFNTMAEELEKFQASNIQKLLVEKSRIDALINNLQDPVLVLDQQNNVVFYNDAAEKITAVSRDQILGKYIQDVAVNNDLIRAMIKELFLSKSEEAASTLKIAVEGKERFYQKQLIPIKVARTGGETAEPMGTLILLQNITTYKELDVAKTNFIATVSHELKTPIASIQLSTQLLDNKRMGNLSDEQSQLVNSIKEDAARLLKITSELLNMTQVETGVIQLKASGVVVNDMLFDLIERNKLMAESKQIRVVREFVGETDLKIWADEEKTSWVLNNLLTNAIKYSPEKSEVKIKVEKKEKQVWISVVDQGKGIQPQYLDKIFDRYFRIPGSEKEGTGLGLSICREFMEAQGGSISVKSEYGMGAEFILKVGLST